ncbi:MAG: HIT family protein [Kiritimatiellae bacterium]|nr:HIT family protein [Kiritimatiellia bacterium]MBR4617137.1 HIT family protein [Kiritimatiellia bacterium]
MSDCIFCKIVEGTIPSFKVYEDDKVLAYLDINPFSPGHTLVIPKVHAANLLECGDEGLGTLIAAVRKVAAHLKTALPCDGFNILQNNGEAAGQTVRHIHFHIIPRYEGGGCEFAPHQGDMAELAALAERVRMA